MTRPRKRARSERPDPPLIEFSGDRTWYRVHRCRWSGNSFNPNTGIISGGRFHPFLDAAGTIVPTLYLADHPQSALRETLFRKQSAQHDRLAAFYHDYMLSTVTFSRPLRLLDLVATEVLGHYAPFSDGGEETYSSSRKLAALLMLAHPDADGIVWSGRQTGMHGFNVAVLFGGRVRSEDISITRSDALTAPRSLALRDLRVCAAACGVRLPHALA